MKPSLYPILRAPEGDGQGGGGRYSYDTPEVLAGGFTLSANEDKSNAQASETFTMRAEKDRMIGAKGETLAFAKPQFDPSGFKALQAQENIIESKLNAITAGSAPYQEWNALKTDIEGLPETIARAERELAKTKATLAQMELTGTAEQKQNWRNNAVGDQQTLDNLLAKQQRLPQLESQLAELAKHPDVSNHAALMVERAEVQAKMEPIRSIAAASYPLFQQNDAFQAQPDLGGDRALLARSVATYKLDQLLGTNVIAEEKMAQTPDGRLMGVSVQVDGAQITGKFGGKDCFLEADYSDPRIQKGLSDLEAVDYITGQVDRHHGNVFIEPSSGKVTGIDNDLAFPGRDREQVLKTPPELCQKAVAGMPRQLSADTAQKILSIHPDKLAAELSSISNPPPQGGGKLSEAEINGAVQRLQNLQTAILAPEQHGIQIVKEFNAQTYQDAIGVQKQLIMDRTGAELDKTSANFKDIDQVGLVKEMDKTSYLAAAVMDGRKYELAKGQVIGGIECGMRDPATANVKARVDPVFAEFKKQEMAAKQTLASSHQLIENPTVRREVDQLQKDLASLQNKMQESQKQLHKLDNPGIAERLKSAMGRGQDTDLLKQQIQGEQVQILQQMKDAQQQLDRALDKAVAPLRTDLLMAAQEKVGEQQKFQEQRQQAMAAKAEQIKAVAAEYGISPQQLQMPNVGSPDNTKEMRDVASNNAINADSFRERGERMLEKDSPAEAKLAFVKADRDQALGEAQHLAAELLDNDDLNLSPESAAALKEKFAAASSLSVKHDQEEVLQNQQRQVLYEAEVTREVGPVLAAKGFSPQEVETFSKAAVKLGMEAESAALQNNERTAKLFAGQLKDGVEKSTFNYSEVNPSASKLHDALYKAYNTNARVHLDGEVEIKRGHASFQEKTANAALKQAALETGVTLDPVAPKVEAPKVDAPKVDAPKVDAAKVDAPKVDAPKVDDPKVEAPKVEAPKVDAPKVEAPKVDAPKVDAPKVDAPKVDAPKVDAPKVDAPKVEAPKVEAPKVEAPKVDAPKVDAPKVDAPKVDATKVSVGDSLNFRRNSTSSPAAKEAADIKKDVGIDPAVKGNEDLKVKDKEKDNSVGAVSRLKEKYEKVIAEQKTTVSNEAKPVQPVIKR